MSVAPGTYGFGLLDFAITRSARGPTGLVLLAELLPGTGSVTPPGGAIVTVLFCAPVVAGGTVPVTVNVAVPPTSRFTAAVTPEGPPLAGQLDPADAVHVHVKLLNAAGSGSLTVAPVTTLGPRFVATIV